MPTEALLQKRAMREALYARQGKSVIDLAAEKRPEAYRQAQDLTAMRAAVKVRVTSGLLEPGAPHPDGTPCPTKQVTWRGVWLAVDGAASVQRRASWDAAGAEAARAAWESQTIKAMLQEELVEGYLDFVTGI